MYIRLAIIALLLAFAAAIPTQLSYQVGQEYVFNLDTIVTTGGFDEQQQQQVAGITTSNLTSTVVCLVNEITNGNYIFVMNMFNTMYSVNQNGDSDVQTTNVADSSNALGYDMYFQQNPNGEIPTVWYDSADSPYYVNVKLGAINAFQTRVISAGASQVHHESDPIGIHTSVFTAEQTTSAFAKRSKGQAATSALSVQKTFDAADVSRFSTDATMTAQNVALTYSSAATINEQGFIESASSQQLVTLVDVQPTSGNVATANKNAKISITQDPFNTVMQTSSTLNVQLAAINTMSTYNLNAKKLRFAQLLSSNYTQATLFSTAANFATQTMSPTPNIDVSATLNAVLAAEPKDKKVFKSLNKLIRFFKSQSQLVYPVLSKTLESVLSTSAAPAVNAARIFYILTGLSSIKAADELLVEYGLLIDASSAQMSEVKLQAVFAAQSAKQPSKIIADALQQIFTQKKDDVRVISSAVLAFGTVLSKITESEIRSQGAATLVNTLNSAMGANNQQQIALVLRAIANSGPLVVPIAKIPKELLSLVQQQQQQVASSDLFNGNVKRAVAHLVRVYNDQYAALNKLVADASLADSNFPFNVSWSKSLSLGGKIANLDVGGNLFAGTNFNCNQQFFNYEGLAQANGSFTFMGETSSLFLAQAIYGKENGQSLANEILLTVLDKTVYDEQLPSLDCNVHTFNLYHATPAWSYEYTVWVSIVPIALRASASLVLNVDWSWNVCDSSLSAMIDITPSAGVELSGDAEINLLYLRAGVELDASLNSDIQPQAYIQGSQCTVGFDVTQTNSPMSASFESYYEWKKCKVLFFDCQWGKHNVQDWWNWSLPANTQTLFQKQYKIAQSA